LRIEFLKELYFHEWDRRAHLSEETNLPTTVATAVLGATFFLLLTFPYRLDVVTALFGALVIAAVCFEMATIYHLYHAIHGYVYERLASTHELVTAKEAILTWHRERGRGGEDCVRQAQADFDSDIFVRFVRATDINRKNNKEKGDFLHRAREAMIRALVFVGLAFVPYLLQTFRIDTPPSSVRLEEPVGVVLEESRMSEREAREERPLVHVPQPSEKVPPARPTLPPNEAIYEDNRPLVRLTEESSMSQQEQQQLEPPPPPPEKEKRPELPPNESIRDERGQVEKR
jgi:hypothetical protein